MIRTDHVGGQACRYLDDGLVDEGCIMMSVAEVVSCRVVQLVREGEEEWGMSLWLFHVALIALPL